MKASGRILFNVVVTLLLAGLTVVFAAEDTSKGEWTITRSDNPGKVEFSLTHRQHGGRSQHESAWPTTTFPGVDFSKPGRQDVRFTIARDAGRLDGEGFLDNGEGAGIFHFSPDAKYPQDMKSLGFDLDDETQYTMAVMDVSLDFARQMKNEKLDDLDAHRLIEFRIFNVNAEFIDGLRSAGLKTSDSQQLVAFRIHGVTPEMVRYLHQAGYDPNADQLVAMRIHGATPEFIEQLKKDGYSHVDIDDLISFRIHGVSPQFVEKIQQLGYSHPEPEQLVTMRIHDVTPEFIAGLQSRGMQNLTIDELVNMRIHGID
jgi:hypothetical protein